MTGETDDEVDQQTRQAWLDNTPPPKDQPRQYDFVIVIRLNEDSNQVDVPGTVSWDDELGQYVFEPIEVSEDGSWEPTTCIGSEGFYVAFRSRLRATVGVHVTRGIEIVSETELLMAEAERAHGAHGRA